MAVGRPTGDGAGFAGGDGRLRRTADHPKSLDTPRNRDRRALYRGPVRRLRRTGQRPGLGHPGIRLSGLSVRYQLGLAVFNLPTPHFQVPFFVKRHPPGYFSGMLNPKCRGAESGQ